MLTKTRTTAVVAMLLAACNDGSANVTITELAPGSKCPTGGFEVRVGNGQPQQVCNGTTGTNGTNGSNGGDGFVTLVNQTALPPGDTRCPAGGVLVQSGLDDGADGGTARDATLSAGEVRSATAVCSGDPGARVGSMTPPPGAAGTEFILANGGASDGGRGGEGGTVQLTNASATNGGHVKVFKTGRVDAAVTSPTPPAFDPGKTPVIIDRDTTVSAQTTDSPALDAGVVFAFADRLYVANVPPLAGTIATSLSVAAGAALRLPSPSRGSWFAFERGCRNAGSITGERIELHCADFVGTPGSSISARAATSTSGGAVSIGTIGSLLNAGSIDVAGRPSAQGGPGGSIAFNAELFVFNSGDLNASAAASLTDSDGTAGGSIRLVGAAGTYNSGAVTATGGNAGIPSEGPLNGGRGGSIFMESTGGPVRATGVLTATGGDALCSECTAGQGGLVALNGVSVLSGARVVALGGGGDVGGHGGTMQVETHSAEWRTAESLWVSGSIDVSGGAAMSSSPRLNRAGDGGDVRFTLSGAAAGAELVLQGYAGISASGGGGAIGGGGGAITLQHGSEDSLARMGGVANTVPLTARGAAGASTGGGGGNVELRTQRWSTVGSWWEVVENAGEIDVRGGDGAVAGRGGFVTISGRADVRIRAVTDARSGSGAQGAVGGEVQVESTGAIAISADVDVSSAGNARASANGGLISIAGGKTQVANALLARGGDATGTPGGQGGSISVTSRDRAATLTRVSVKGGAGIPAGEGGLVLVDGFDATTNWEH